MFLNHPEYPYSVICVTCEETYSDLWLCSLWVYSHSHLHQSMSWFWTLMFNCAFTSLTFICAPQPLYLNRTLFHLGNYDQILDQGSCLSISFQCLTRVFWLVNRMLWSCHHCQCASCCICSMWILMISNHSYLVLTLWFTWNLNHLH